MEGKIVNIPKRLSWDFIESRMTPIGGTNRAIIDVFSKCFQLSIFTPANTLLADPAPPWHQNFRSCVIVVGILIVIFCIVYAEKASPSGKKNCHTACWCCRDAIDILAHVNPVCTWKAVPFCKAIQPSKYSLLLRAVTKIDR
jgi:hypothetical protein